MKDKMITLIQSYKHYIFISLSINIVLAVIVVTVLYSVGGFPVYRAEPSVTRGLSAVDISATSDGQYESRIVEIVDQTSPAVVSIVISKDVPIVERYYREYDPFGGFGGLFGGFGGFQVPEYRQKGTEKKEVGGGSGFFVSADGLIVTNRHVVSDESATYTVLTNDGKKHDAKVITRDTLFDIALLEVEGDSFAYLDFGDSSLIKPGQTAIAIGNTLAEFSNSVSVGVISGLSRSIVAGDGMGRSEHLNNVIQTDAAINPGNSGGPLLNLKGEVVGVNVAQASGSENVGFALPSNTVKSIVQSVKDHGSIVRPYLGLRYTTITPELIEKNNLSVEYGVLVSRGETVADLAVIPGSPADKAGILENDIITAVDGIELRDGMQLNEVIGQKTVGQNVSLTVIRKGEEIQVRVKLEKTPKQNVLSVVPR
jgi:serine protease Do